VTRRRDSGSWEGWLRRVTVETARSVKPAEAGRETALAAVEPVRISMLGGFAVRRGPHLVAASAWQHRNSARSLLKLLALQPARRLHREQISDMLWPDADPESASAQLRKALHAVRHALEPDLKPRAASAYLEHGGQVIHLVEDRVSIDVEEFRRLASVALRSLDEADLVRAVDAYGGELLPEDRYPDWAETPRRELAGTYRELLLRLSSTLEARAELSSAIERVQQAIGVDPTDESMYYRLMKLHMRTGSRHGALLAYRECRRALDEELGVEPSAETEALHEELVSGVVDRDEAEAGADVVPDQVLRETQPLVGRADVMNHLREQLSSAAKGTGTVVLLRGEAGVGKTRTAVEAAREAAAGGATVLWGTAFEEENLLPYAVFGDMLSAFVGSLSSQRRAGFVAGYPELLPILHVDDALKPRSEAQPPTQFEQARIFRGVGRFLTDLSLQRPLVLVLEDLHLADSASLQLIKHLGRGAPRAAWVVLGTYREEDVVASEALQQFLAAALRTDARGVALCRQIELAGLSEEECSRLTHMLIRGDDAAPVSVEPEALTALADRIHAWSLGNPLFVTELVQVVREQGSVERLSLETGADGGIANGVRGVIEEHVGRLSRECRRALALASAAGLQWPFRLLTVAAGAALDPPLSEGRLVDLFDEALGRRVLEEIVVGDSWGYAFRHPLVQAVLYGSLSRRRRMHFHRVLGEAVEVFSPEEIEILAHHFHRSDDEPKAERYLEAAAHRAINLYANEAAKSYLQDLIGLLDRQGRDIEAARVRRDLGRCLLMLARFDEAALVLEQAASVYAAEGDPGGVGTVTALLAQVEGERGSPQRGLERLCPVLDRVDEISRPELLVNLFFAEARLSFLGGGYEESLGAGLRMRQEALRVDDETERTVYLGQAESCVGVAQQMLGEWDAACTSLGRAIDLSESVGDLESLSRSLNNIGSAFGDAGRFGEALAYLERALEVARRVGEPTKIAWQMSALANIQNLLGQWDDSERLLGEALDLLMTLERSWFTAYPMVQLAQQYIQRGQLNDARELMARAMPLVEGSGDLQIARWAQGRLASIDLLEGNPVRAVDRIRPVLDRPGLEESDVTNLLPLLAEALVEVDPAEARTVAENAVARSRAQHDCVSLVDALNAGGLVALAEGNAAAAAGDFTELLDLTRSMPYPFAEGQALLGLARCDVMASGVANKETLESAAGIFRRLRATPELMKVEALASAVPPESDSRGASQNALRKKDH
jgi:DNA-binding SARP family transcriptional activator